MSKKILFAITFTFIIFGCSENENHLSKSMSYGKSTAQYQSDEALIADDSNISKKTSISQNSSSDKTVTIERKLTKDGYIEFETNDLESTRAQIFASVKKHKGYISSDQSNKYSGTINNTIVIKVPAKNFDDLLNDATKGVSKFENKNIQVSDVTEEFLDIEARLKTKKELEKRYLELLNKTNNVTELLKVERELGRLRSDIESVEGRLKYLENKISLSTITITFHQKTDDSEFGNQFVDGFKNGWNNLILFFILLTNIWPFIIIAIILLFVIKAFFKKRRKNKNS